VLGECSTGAPDDLVQIHRAHEQAAPSRVGEHLPGEASRLLGGCFDVDEVLAYRVVWIECRRREARIADDDDEQVVQLVGDATRQDREALEPLRLEQPPLRRFGAPPLDRVPQRTHDQPAVDVALDQVVLGTLVDSLERQRLVAVPRHHHHRRGGRTGAHRAKRLEPIAVGQRQIQQHRVRRRRLDRGERLREPLDVHDREPPASFLLDPELREPGVRLIVLHEEEAQRPPGRAVRGECGAHVVLPVTLP
jgi:hypothetical protein